MGQKRGRGTTTRRSQEYKESSKKSLNGSFRPKVLRSERLAACCVLAALLSPRQGFQPNRWRESLACITANQQSRHMGGFQRCPRREAELFLQDFSNDVDLYSGCYCWGSNNLSQITGFHLTSMLETKWDKMIDGLFLGGNVALSHREWFPVWQGLTRRK